MKNWQAKTKTKQKDGKKRIFDTKEYNIEINFAIKHNCKKKNPKELADFYVY